MRFTFPGLMPDEPERFADLREIKISGEADAHYDWTYVEDGVPVSLAGKEFMLVITNKCDEEVDVEDAVEVLNEEDGKLRINFSAGTREVVEVDEGMSYWVLTEIIDDVKHPLIKGSIFRRRLAD